MQKEGSIFFLRQSSDRLLLEKRDAKYGKESPETTRS